MILAIWIIILILSGLCIYRIYASPFSRNFNECIDNLGLPIVSFKSNDKTFNFLVDTGSNLSHLKLGVVEQMDAVKVQNDSASDITTGNGKVENYGYYAVKLQFGKKKFNQVFEIMDLEDTFKDWGIPVDGILGVDFLTTFKYKIDFSLFRMYV